MYEVMPAAQESPVLCSRREGNVSVADDLFDPIADCWNAVDWEWRGDGLREECEGGGCHFAEPRGEIGIAVGVASYQLV